MTRILVTTNHREAPLQAASGWLYVVDLDKLQVLQVTEGVEPPNRAQDHNPRGGMRGMRGISFRNSELAVAGYSAVFFFDRQWNLLRTFTHPSISAIHEILYVEDGIWVTSTANDLLAKFDLLGDLHEIHYLRAQRGLMKELGGPVKELFTPDDIVRGKQDFRDRSYFKADRFDRVHINGLVISKDGNIYLSLGLIVGDTFEWLMNVKTFMRRVRVWDAFLSLNRFLRRALGFEKGMLSELVVQPNQGKSAIVSRDARGAWRVHQQFTVPHNPSHSLRQLSDGTWLYLVTSQGKLIQFEENGTVLFELKLTEKFLRGLLVLPDQQLIIGAGNSLLVYDFRAKRTVAEIELSRDTLNTVFDVQIYPDEFELPPASLHAKIGRIAGYSGSNVIWKK